MANTGPNNSKASLAFFGAVAFVVAMVIAAAVVLYLHYGDSTSSHQLNTNVGISSGDSVNLRPELQKVAQPPTAKQVSDQLNGTNFTAISTKGGTTLALEAGNFYIGSKKYAIDTFLNASNRDAWLPLAEKLGVVPYWVSPYAVVYPSVT